MIIKHKTENLPCIWAIAGGKGGTGKSFLTSSMGMFLSKMQNKTILIDSDLGGANLHSFLGIKKPLYSLSDFFDKNSNLEDILLKTNIENLYFITGDINSFSPHSIKFFQRERFFKHVKKLNADNILIDLGAGSTLSTIDTFLLADKMIVVLIPQVTSYDNLYLFITKLLFRKIGNVLKDLKLEQTVFTIWKKRESINIVSFKDFIIHLQGISPEVKKAVDKVLSETEINIILNQVRNTKDIIMGSSIKSILIKYFNISAKYIGFVKYNDNLWRSIHQSFSILDSKASTSSEILKITNNLMSSLHEEIKNKPEKKNILTKKSEDFPLILSPNTDTALQLVNNKSLINIKKFPFKIGRISNNFIDSIKYRNDLNFYDEPPFSISRAHFMIFKQENSYYFEDIGSKLGTIVNGKKIGGVDNLTKNILLNNGNNTLIFGHSKRNLIFSLQINEI